MKNDLRHIAPICADTIVIAQYELEYLLEALRRDLRAEKLKQLYTASEERNRHAFNVRTDISLLELLRPKKPHAELVLTPYERPIQNAQRSLPGIAGLVEPTIATECDVVDSALSWDDSGERD